jgi:hypothetical protein
VSQETCLAGVTHYKNHRCTGMGATAPSMVRWSSSAGTGGSRQQSNSFLSSIQLSNGRANAFLFCVICLVRIPWSMITERQSQSRGPLKV